MNLEWYLQMGRELARIYREELGRPLLDGDEEGLPNWLWHLREGPQTVQWVQDRIHESSEAVAYRERRNNPGPEPEPEPVPIPPPSTNDCGDQDNPTLSRLACVEEVSRTSPYWANAQNSGINCHLFVREVARALQAGQDKFVGNWGLITKNAGEQQCNEHECGRHIHGGYGEDVVAFLYNGDNPENQWIGFDVVVNAGAPNPSLAWGQPIPRRVGNHFISIDDIE